MRSRDERADNLISRLFSYSPRANRQPLEDYCTEALAWCLRRCPEFLDQLLREAVGDERLKRLRARSAVFDIHTQLPFASIIEEEEETDIGDYDTANRFDLVIEAGLSSPIVIVVESKIASGFGHTQLEKYHVELANPENFPGVPPNARYLVTLTTRPYQSPWTNGSITWPQIHSALSACGKASKDGLVAELLIQFASFLNEKGLSMLELRNIDAKVVDHWFEVQELELQLERILNRLRSDDDVKPIIGRRKPKKDGNEWIGVYGKNDFWAGFGILKQSTNREVVLWVEITLPGDQRHLIKTFDAKAKRAFEAAATYLKLYYPEDTALNRRTSSNSDSRFIFATPIIDKL